VPGDVESSRPPIFRGPAGAEHRRDGPPLTGLGITVQVIGLDRQHVRVVERRTRRDESAVFIELAGIDCKVTLAGRLNRLQQVTAEIAHQLAQIEEAQRAAAGQ
jgi:hypothetical protein